MGRVMRNPLHSLRDWTIGPGGWLIDSNLDNQLSNTDIELDQEQQQTTWADQMSAEDEDHPEDIHIIHNGDTGWNYWFQTPTGLIAGIGYRTQAKAWKAALLDREYHQQ